MSESCPICFKSDESLFKLSRCKELICIKCLYEHIQNNFNCTIKCPNGKCKKSIAEPDIRKFLSNAQEDKYTSMCLGKCLKKCPTIGCAHFYDTDKKDEKVAFQCPECDQPICSACNCNHFPNEKCDTFEEHRNEFGRQKLRENHTKQIQNIDNDNDLLESHVSFECSICLSFQIPKRGVMLRCFCNFCLDCLKEAASVVEYENQMKCANCKTPWNSIEMMKLVGPEKLEACRHKIMKSKCFHCKTPDCTNLWYKEREMTSGRCEICEKENCYLCDAVHEGKLCEEFKNSPIYKDHQKNREILGLEQSVKCFQCRKYLVLAEGCGALKCNTCNIYTCVFTGLLVGENGCQCTPEFPCHDKCKYGCIPEDH